MLWDSAVVEITFFDWSADPILRRLFVPENVMFTVAPVGASLCSLVIAISSKHIVAATDAGR